jgi:Ala-tRNA(Pro) deacylase
MPTRRIKQFLNDHGVKYVTISHSPAYTAQEIAATAHVRGKDFAKSVVVKLDGRLALAVVPASVKIDLALVREVTGAKRAELAHEIDFSARFPECEPGAMPPFGNLYGMPVYLDDHLRECREITFNAGTHHELIRMQSRDFARLVEPEVVPLTMGVRA